MAEQGWQAGTVIPLQTAFPQGSRGLCGAEPVQLWEAETQQGFPPPQNTCGCVGTALGGCWIPGCWRFLGIFLLKDHPKDNLGEAAEVCSSSAFTAHCLPSVVLLVCLSSRKHFSEEQELSAQP